MRGRWLRRVAVCGLLVSLVVLVAGPAAAWWDGKWKYRKKIVLDTTPQGGDIKEGLADFPVLVRLHTGNFTFENAKGDGADIRFIASDDKTPLKYHIERYDPPEEMVLIWVKVPKSHPPRPRILSGSTTATALPQTGDDAGGNFDTSQLVVYHLGEKEGVPQDATSYKNNGKEFTGKLATPSPIGRGITLKGEGDRLVIAKSPSLSFAKGFTFSAWVRMARSQTDGRLFSWEDGKQSVVIAVEGTKLTAAISGQKKNSARQGRAAAVQVGPRGGDRGARQELSSIRTERAEDGAEASGALPEPAADIAVGASLQGKHGFAGDLDEVGITGVARIPAWVHAAAVGRGSGDDRSSPTRTRKAPPAGRKA